MTELFRWRRRSGLFSRRRAASLGLVLLSVAVATVPMAHAKRPANPVEKAAMLPALKQIGGPDCFAISVSTVNARYAGVRRAPGPTSEPCLMQGSLMLVRDGSRWSIRHGVSETEWYCHDQYAPFAVIKDLWGKCISTQRAWSFVTPSGNIACTYRPDRQVDDYGENGDVWCYVRSSKTLVVAYSTGRRISTVRRGVTAPRDLRDLRGPILTYGSTWIAPSTAIRCVSRATSLRCKDWFGGGFEANRDGIRTFTPSAPGG